MYIQTCENVVAQLCLTLCDPMDYRARQAPLSMEFSRQGYWSGSPFPSPGDLPNPGIEPESPALQAEFLPSEPPGKPQGYIWTYIIQCICTDMQFIMYYMCTHTYNHEFIQITLISTQFCWVYPSFSPSIHIFSFGQ